MATTDVVCVCVTCGGQGTIGDGGYIHCPACAHVWDQIIPLQPATSVEPRLAVRRFAEAMEAKLRRRDDRGPWAVDGVYGNINAIQGEWHELAQAVGLWEGAKMLTPQTADQMTLAMAAVLDEAVDVALRALFVADMCGALGVEHDGRGR